jgi:hypothetical protein
MLSFVNEIKFNIGLLWLAIGLSTGLLLLLIYPLLAPRFRQPLLLLRWVLVPYLGLLTGGLSPRLMGLTGINWLASFGLGLGLIGALLALLILVRTLINLTQEEPTLKPAPKATDPVWSLLPALQIGAEEFHWSFLRGVLWETLLGNGLTTAQAGYWAVWLAALLALPAILRYQPTTIARLLKGAMLLMTTVLFFYTHNFWLCWLLHGMAWSLLNPTHLRVPLATPALRQQR